MQVSQRNSWKADPFGARQHKFRISISINNAGSRTFRVALVRKPQTESQQDHRDNHTRELEKRRATVLFIIHFGLQAASA